MTVNKQKEDDLRIIKAAFDRVQAHWRALGKRVVKHRLAGMTRQQIAEREGLHVSAVNLILQKKGMP